MATKFSWVLYPHHEYLWLLQDEFAVRQLRLRVQGNSLEVEVEHAENEEVDAQARGLADRYIKLLQIHLAISIRPLTIEEFQSMPARMQAVKRVTRQDRERVNDAIRRARNELLASSDPTLRQVYDYIQNARERQEEGLFDLYKAVEVIKNQFGGQTRAIEILNIGTELEFLKRLANEPQRDVRHAPKVKGAVQRPEWADKVRAMEYAIRIVRAYAQYLERRDA